MSRMEIFKDFLSQRKGHGLRIPAPYMLHHIKNMKKPHHRDSWGITPYSLYLTILAAPHFLRASHPPTLHNSTDWTALEISGYCKAKVVGSVTADKIRTIVPLPVPIKIIDMELADMIGGLADFSASGISTGYFEGSRKRRSVLDTTFACRLALERGLDARSRCSIAVADIEKYYDFLQPLKVAQHLESLVSVGSAEPMDGSSVLDISVTLLCLHVFPRIALRVGTAVATMPSKNTGMLTGSASSAASGRLPPADMARCLLPNWQSQGLGLQVPGSPGLCLMSYVDNFIAVGATAADNVAVLESAEQFLRSRWNLRFGASSREVLPCAGAHPSTLPKDAVKWPVRESIRCLGCILQRNGRSDRCVLDALHRAYRAVTLNCGNGLHRAGRSAKFRFMNSCVRSVGRWKWASWTYIQKTADLLDNFQKHLCSILWRVIPESGESHFSYMDRLHRNSKLVAQDAGLWSESWACDVVEWWKHTDRNHCEGWTKAISGWNTQTWLQQQRDFWANKYPAALGPQAHRTRTNTRVLRGTPSMRWSDGAAWAEQVAMSVGHGGFGDCPRPQ